MPELPVENLTGVQIFSIGTWTSSQGNRVTITTADLDEMVLNFALLKDRVKPYLKLMHLSDKDHRRVTAMPALGWMSALRRDGGKLIADFAKVPQKVAMLIRAGTYRRISAEIFHRWRDASTGKLFRNVVGAAGLLGATAPAVTTLDDVMKLFAISDEQREKLEEYSLTTHTFDDTPWDDCNLNQSQVAMSFALAENVDTEIKHKGVSWMNGAMGVDISVIPADLQRALASGALGVPRIAGYEQALYVKKISRDHGITEAQAFSAVASGDIMAFVSQIKEETDTP